MRRKFTIPRKKKVFRKHLVGSKCENRCMYYVCTIYMYVYVSHFEVDFVYLVSQSQFTFNFFSPRTRMVAYIHAYVV